jgi:hypothetical protein
MQRRSFVGGSAMVWGGKTERDRTILVVVAGNLTEIRYQGELIQRYVVPFIQAQTLSKGKRDSSVNKILTQSYLRNLK